MDANRSNVSSPTFGKLVPGRFIIFLELEEELEGGGREREGGGREREGGGREREVGEEYVVLNYKSRKNMAYLRHSWFL